MLCELSYDLPGREAKKIDASSTPPPTATWKVFLGSAYMCAMGVCGVVLTAIGSTLDSLASDCGTTSLKVGTVFLARGAGAITGALISAKLYRW